MVVIDTQRYTTFAGETIVRYRIATHQSDEGHSASVSDLPGRCSRGASQAEAVESIKDAIREYLGVVDERLRGEDIREIEVTA